MSYSASETSTISFDGPSVRGWAAAGSEWLAENVSRERKADKLSIAEAPVEPCLRKIPETYRSAAPLPVVESYSVGWKSPEFVRRTMSRSAAKSLSECCWKNCMGTRWMMRQESLQCRLVYNSRQAFPHNSSQETSLSNLLTHQMFVERTNGFSLSAIKFVE